jgi:hypothetical protein
MSSPYIKIVRPRNRKRQRRRGKRGKREDLITLVV